MRKPIFSSGAPRPNQFGTPTGRKCATPPKLPTHIVPSGLVAIEKTASEKSPSRVVMTENLSLSKRAKPLFVPIHNAFLASR